MLFSGIDIGSQSTDVVIVSDTKEIVSHVIAYTGVSHLKTAQKAMHKACLSLGCEPQDISYTVTTGYGRKNIPQSDSHLTEISCHAKGAYFLFPEATAVIDIGGQDSKVISLDARGGVKDFVMNEKCAAGTGRFLETMARIMEIDVSVMAEYSLKAKKASTISSTCTVFAESEVISKIAMNEEKADIIYGIHISACKRVLMMCRKLGIGSKIVMTGGVAKNLGMVRILERELETGLLIPEEPQIVGALGAALFALEKYRILEGASC
jgi:predicted CoA-substrate-specific enzyme activase